METDLVLGLTLAGLTLGIVEGVKPGPLLTTVIKETLTAGFRGGMRAASAPIFTDGPLILFSILQFLELLLVLSLYLFYPRFSCSLET